MGTCPFSRKAEEQEEPRTFLHEEKQEPLHLQEEQESSPPEEQEYRVEEEKNDICPCGSEMERDEMRPGWRCCSCLKTQSGSEMQWCSDDYCIYERITGRSYMICPECYQTARTDGFEYAPNEEHAHPEEHRVLNQKLNESIKRMKEQIDIYLSNSSDGDGVYEALLSAIKDANLNMNCEFTVSTLKKNRMSWRQFDEEAVEFLDFEHFVALFGANDGVSHEQWKSIYDAMKTHVHQNGDVMARKHLCAVHTNFYKLWLLKLKDTEFGATPVYDEMNVRFKEFYKSTLKRLQSKLDRAELDLDEKSLFSEEQKKSMDEEWEIFQKARLKWNELREHQGGEFVIHLKDTKCGDIADCGAFQRLEFVMDLFRDHFLKKLVYENDVDENEPMHFLNILEHSLPDYGPVAMSDDLEHVHESHVLTEHTIIECAHRKDNRECVGEMMRMHRKTVAQDMHNDDDSKADGNRFDNFMMNLDPRKSHLAALCAKMHTALCHPVFNDRDDVKEDINTEDHTASFPVRPQNEEAAKDTQKKFVNEIVVQEEKDEKQQSGRVDELGPLLKRAGFPNAECQEFLNLLYQHEYDSEAVLDDLADGILYGLPGKYARDSREDSQLFTALKRSPFWAKMVRKHLAADGHDDDELSPFSFGKSRMYHWEHYHEDEAFLAVPKYGTLKEECLQNSYYPLTLKLFYHNLVEAVILSNSQKARKLKAVDRGDDNNRIEMPFDAPLSVSHIFVLLLYCNQTDLQYMYKKNGTRETNVQQTVEDLKRANSEIARWYKLLTEAVMMFGARVSGKDKFFTGLNAKLSFSSFIPIWNAPFSTTVELSVAGRFCDNSGVILKLQPSPNSWDQYFNTEWLSIYRHEKERLFIKASGLVIVDVREGPILKPNRRYFNAFNLFSSLFQGHFVADLAPTQQEQDKMEKQLLSLITVYKVNNGIESRPDSDVTIKISLYIQQLFFQLLRGFKSEERSHLVVRSEYKRMSDSMRKELFEIRDGDEGQCLYLSPFLSSLRGPEQIEIMTEVTWNIEGGMMEFLQSRTTAEPIHSKVYSFDGLQEGAVLFQFKMKRKTGGSDFVGFGITILSTPCQIQGKMNVMIGEVKWCLNGVNLNNMVSRKYVGRLAFKDDLVNKVDTLTVKVSVHFWSQ